MLSLLKIRNLALVDELFWELQSGLIAITGETGAGKSVIIGALKLVLGERADKSLIRSGEEQCTVEAIFDVAKHQAMSSLLEESGIHIDAEEPIIIRRVISNQLNRQFINDSPVSLSLLKKLSDYLVDLYGPHDHQSLFSQDRQLFMLDAYANTQSEKEQYRKAFQDWKEKKTILQELEQAELASESELELLNYQADEIQAANLTLHDEQELEERWKRSANAARLTELAAQIAHAVNSEEGILTQGDEVLRYFRDLEKLDPSVHALNARFHQTITELEDIHQEIEAYSEQLDLDPQIAQQLEQRMNLVETLKRKYGNTISEILEHHQSIVARLDCIENRAEKLEDMQAEVQAARFKLDQAAQQLTAKRKKAAPLLAQEISSQLKDLGFYQASFEIPLQPLDEPHANGFEQVDFHFGPNPGEPVLPLRQIASSGEVSRLMLAIKSALANQDATPLMVFDEIDANVGGEIARSVGQKMAKLGQQHQVIAITHFPQVAALAQHHFLVEKEVVANRTHSRMIKVTGDKRTEELVRMLGGGGAQVQAMAVSLLSESE